MKDRKKGRREGERRENIGELEKVTRKAGREGWEEATQSRSEGETITQQ